MQGSDSNTYTLGGSLNATGSVEVTALSPETTSGSLTATVTGTISISGGGVNISSCVVSLTKTMTIAPTGLTLTYSGTTCAVSVSGEMDVTL